MEVNVPVESQLFQGLLKELQDRKIVKKYIEWDYQLSKNVSHYGCLTKKTCQLKSPAMAGTFVGLADVSFHYNSFPL